MNITRKTTRSKVKTNKRRIEKDGIFKTESVQITNINTDKKSAEAFKKLCKEHFTNSGLDNWLNDLDLDTKKIIEDAGLALDAEISQIKKFTDEWWAFGIRKLVFKVREAINDKDVYQAATQAALLAQKTSKFYIIHPLEREIIKGVELYKSQSDKAHKSGQARWGDRTAINNILTILKYRTDELYDRLPAKELWSVFYGELDKVHLDPRETGPAIPVDDSRISWIGNSKGMTFKTFKTRLSG